MAAVVIGFPALGSAASNTSIDVLGLLKKVDVRVPYDIRISGVGTGRKVTLSATIEASLEDLQSKFSKIASEMTLPRDNCASYGQNLTGRISGASLGTGSDKEAVVAIDGSVVAWDCQRGVPGGGTTVRYKLKCWRVLGKKVCTKVPWKTEVKPGPDIKNKIGTADVSLEVAMKLKVDVEAGTVAIFVSDPRKVEIDPKSTLLRLVNGIAEMFGAGVSKLTQRVKKDLGRYNLGMNVLPPDLREMGLRLQDAQFVKGPDGKLGIHVTFAAEVSSENLVGLDAGGD